MNMPTSLSSTVSYSREPFMKVPVCDPGNPALKQAFLPQQLTKIPFKENPFYETIATVLYPQLLIDHTNSQSRRDNALTLMTSVNFHIPAHMGDQIMANARAMNSTVVFTHNIVARFCKYSPDMFRSIVLSDELPRHLSLTLLDKVIPLSDILPTNKQAQDGRRHPKPIELTPSVQLCQGNGNAHALARNDLRVKWTVQGQPMTEYFYVGIYLMRRIQNGDFIFRTPTIPAHEIRAKYETRISKDSEDLVASNYIPLHLTCAISGKRIKIPVKNVDCTHVRAFDIESYLHLNFQKATWRCPVCKLETLPNHLRIDGFLESILHDFKSSEAEKVYVMSDGSWQLDVPDESKKEIKLVNQIAAKSSRAAEDFETIDLVSDNEEEIKDKNSSAISAIAAPAPHQPLPPTLPSHTTNYAPTKDSTSDPVEIVVSSDEDPPLETISDSTNRNFDAANKNGSTMFGVSASQNSLVGGKANNNPDAMPSMKLSRSKNPNTSAKYFVGHTVNLKEDHIRAFAFLDLRQSKRKRPSGKRVMRV